MSNLASLLEKHRKDLGKIDLQSEESGVFRLEHHFVCPICAKVFDLTKEADVALLSEEHVPPKALGGTPSVATCRQCNNECGHSADAYLKNYIEIQGCSALSSLYGARGTIQLNQNIVNARIKYDESGFHFNIPPKINNPVAHKTFIKDLHQIKDGSTFNLEFHPAKYSKLDNHAACVAALKTGYLILFREYGYSYVLGHPLSRVCEQIQKPKENILQRLEIGRCVSTIISEWTTGIFLAKCNEISLLIVVYEVRSENGKKYKIGTLLPIDDDSFYDISKDVEIEVLHCIKRLETVPK